MLDLDADAQDRAAGLTADGKQKISLGRGLVRSDVNVIMFDEPLTVIDPHLKWLLRSKLKELHQRIRRTMIYVTHDQTEALTFADQVVVMIWARSCRSARRWSCSKRPKHTFVGHFIGSPGMNILPCQLDNGASDSPASRSRPPMPRPSRRRRQSSRSACGRSSSRFADDGIPVDVVKERRRALPRGGHALPRPEHQAAGRRRRVVPQGAAHLRFDPTKTRVYATAGW